MKTTVKKATEIVDGDLVYEQGHLMKAKNIEHYIDNGRIVARFEGYCVNKDDDIYNTGYNGGRYGGNDLALYAVVEK
jgi:hypothetical protein